MDYFIDSIHIDFDPNKPESVAGISEVRLQSNLRCTPEQLARNLRLGSFYHVAYSDFVYQTHEIVVQEHNGQYQFKAMSPEIGKALLDLPRF